MFLTLYFDRKSDDELFLFTTDLAFLVFLIDSKKWEFYSNPPPIITKKWDFRSTPLQKSS